MKVSDYIVLLLKKFSVKKIFGYIGGFNADFVDSFCSDKGNKFILNYNEQASAFAATSYSILTEKVSLATASGAPSSCNLISGIAEAYFDSISCVFIVGSVHSLAVKDSKELRQNAFEEIDMVSTVQEITKYAVKLKNTKYIRYEIEKAFHIASSGRKGPVLIELPYDIARADINPEELPAFTPPAEEYEDIPLRQIQEILSVSRRPLVLLGGGARSSQSREALLQWLNNVKIPVVASLCGLDAIPHDHPCFLGFIGHYGHRYANIALGHADCLIIIGSRLDERQLGGYRSKFAAGTKLIRVDVDKYELGRKFSEELSLHASAEKFLAMLAGGDYTGFNYNRWIRVVNAWKNRFPSYDVSLPELSANNFLYSLSEYLTCDAIICADVGQNQMCVAQALRLDGDRRLLNSAGYGSMGYSLPAAIGAAHAFTDRMVVSINGDGGIQMNLQELHTIVRDQLAVNIIVLNNQCLGMLRSLQEKMYNNRTYVSVDGYSIPSYQNISQAYGIPYLAIKDISEASKIEKFLSCNGPTFTEVFLPIKMINLPEPGDTLMEQLPLLSKYQADQIFQEIQSTELY